MRAGSISRRCRCRDAAGKDLGASCPKLGRRGHGSWHVRQELPAAARSKRRRFRRDGYATADDASDALDQVRTLLRLAEEEDAEELVGALLDELDKDEPLPKVDDVKRRLQAGLALDDRGTMGPAMWAWYEQ